MALVVETGSGVAGADSFVTLENARVLAESRGKSLPEDTSAAESALRNGADFVNSFRARYAGAPTTAAQGCQFPRTGCARDGRVIANNIIPAEVILAQVFAAVEYGNGVDLLPTASTAPVAYEKIGSIATSYDTTGGGSLAPVALAVRALLFPFFRAGGMARVVRI